MNSFCQKKINNCFVALSCTFLIFTNQSCIQKESPIEFATKWTADIKVKIIEDANRQPDRTFVDSIRHEVTLFKDNTKLKQFYIVPRKDQDENQKIIYDTSMIVLYSKDQNFQLVINPCIYGSERSYEGIAYQGNRYGLAEYKYCKKDIIEKGFHFKNLNVGTWSKYTATGKELEKTDVGNDEKLEKLRDMKYYR